MEAEIVGVIERVAESVEVWLKQSAAVDEEAPGDRGNTAPDFAEVLSLIHAAETKVKERGQCLPLKLTLKVLEMTQRLWASTAHCATGNSSGAPHEVPRLRVLITHAYLLAHNVFAPDAVRDEYLRHHLLESEKAVLMCLQTAKRLSRSPSSSEQMPAAWELLDVAQIVADACARELSFNQHLGVELGFARLALTWSSGDAASTVLAHAEAVVESIEGNRVYEELFLQFVFTRHDVPIASEESYRGLLALSLRVLERGKGSATDESVKQRVFRGTTHLQLALSHLRSENYVEAVDAASTAAALMDTVEPLVTQLQAMAHLGEADKAFCLFTDIAGRLPTCTATTAVKPTDELFALADLLINTNPQLSDRVAAFLVASCICDSTEARVSLTTLPRLVAFLIHTNTDSCARETVRVLSANDASKTHFRYFFSCLCGLHQPQRLPAPLPRATAVDALSLALRRFAHHVASFEEAEAVLTELAALVLHCHSERTQDALSDEEAALTSLVSFFDAHWCRARTVHLTPGAPCVVLHAEVLLVLGRDEEALAVCRELLAIPDVTLRCGAFGSLVNDLLDRSASHTKSASNVAELLLMSNELEKAFPSVRDFVEMARVYVVGLLVRHAEHAGGEDDTVDCVSSAMVDLLLEKVTPAIQGLVHDSALDATSVEWWCKCFWHVGQLVVGQRLSATVALTHAAVEWFERVCSPLGSPESTALIANRASFLLEIEFDLFVAACAWLTVPQLQTHITRLEALLPLNQPRPLSLCFAQAELAVRSAAETGTAECSETETVDGEALGIQARLTAHGNQLKACGATPEDLEALAVAVRRCSRTAPSGLAPTFITGAVAIELLAVRSDPDDPTVTWRTVRQNALVCYKAYQMATAPADRLRVVCLALDCLRKVPETPHATPAEDVTAVECVAEFFAVEAWNNVVRFNASHDRPATLQWKEKAVALAETLTSASITRSTVVEFASKMPLL